MKSAQTTTPSPASRLTGCCSNRRGVLLLVVVSMLTLFLLLGTTYLVVAARARQAARAYARVAEEQQQTGQSRLLDAVLLKVVRGGAGGVTSLSGTTISGTFESLLADKYGATTSGTGTATTIATVPATPLLAATVSLVGTTASELPGRILTFLPSNAAPTSHRILSAKGANTFSLVLDNPVRRRSSGLPAAPVAVVVNGLEFDGVSGNEPYDGFDDRNIFLTHVAPADSATQGATQSVASSIVKKFAFVVGGDSAAILSSGTVTMPNGLPLGADNDNDGVVDGLFFDFGLPSMTASDGFGTMNFDASVLIVDLDSRFNVNTHGSLTPIVYPGGATGWPSPGGNDDIPSLRNVPLGSGYGPAEVNGAWMFPQSSYSAEPSRRMRKLPSDLPREANSDSDEIPDTDPFPADAVQALPFVLSGAANTIQSQQTRPNTSRFSSGSPLPQIGKVEGRYGEGSINRIAEDATGFSKRQRDEDTWIPLQSPSFAIARPGAPQLNDTLSLIRDAGLTLSDSNFVAGSNLGIPSVWWSGTQGFDWSPSGGYGPRSSFNSPPDLHGRMLTITATATDIVPRLMFAKPEWGAGEMTDDPYEVRLDARAPRNAIAETGGTASDNIFGYAELEALLRQYDRDAPQLPKRLITLLGPAGEEARLRVTTDSWDTTLITGTAARRVRHWLAGSTGSLPGTSAITGLLANEAARGERLNLTRPLSPINPGSYDPQHPFYAQRQALFKDLFTLVLFVSGTTAPSSAFVAEAAQWAANVVEFQDADSTITPFEYDKAIGNSPHAWKVDGDVRTETADEAGRRAVVWGAERPEIVIREGFAWQNSSTTPPQGGVVLSLHRPWKSTAVARVSGSNVFIPAEPCDFALDTLVAGQPSNRVDLGKKPAGDYNDTSAATLPVWRIRINAGGATQYVRFDSGTATGNQYVISPAIIDGNGKPKLGVDSTLTIASGTSIITGPTATSGTSSIVLAGANVVVPNLKITTSGTAYLERLSDLAFPLSNTSGVPGRLVTSATVSGQDVWDADQATLGASSDTRVPLRYVVVDQCPLLPVETNSATDTTGSSSIRTASAASTAFWKTPASPASSGAAYTIRPGTTTTPPMPTAISGSQAAWFVWPNRPLVSAAELYLVPKRSPERMLQDYTKPTAASNDLVSLNLPFLLDAVHVPTRFAAVHTTINASGTSALADEGIFPEISPNSQISSYREPGRVNVNTITSKDVWNALIAGPLQVSGSARPLVEVSGSAGAGFAQAPAQSVVQTLALSASGASPKGDTYAGSSPLMDQMRLAKDRNPLHEIYTATRLANTVTTRSHVFGIWITVRERVDDDPDSVKLHRALYIVDRSIPVAHEPGKDHNVWDCVVLRRIIE
jgi:hypothetical protein